MIGLNLNNESRTLSTQLLSVFFDWKYDEGERDPLFFYAKKAIISNLYYFTNI